MLTGVENLQPGQCAEVQSGAKWEMVCAPDTIYASTDPHGGWTIHTPQSVWTADNQIVMISVCLAIAFLFMWVIMWAHVQVKKFEMDCEKHRRDCEADIEHYRMKLAARHGVEEYAQIKIDEEEEG